MPQSRTRTSRAAMRARYRKPKRRRSGSMGWNAAIAAVVIVGIVLVILTVNGNDSGNAGTGPPRAANQVTGEPGDHWHTYLGVNVCGEWLANMPEFEQPAGSPAGTQNAGIHSHGDGHIHTHPFAASEAGNNATLGRFADYAGFSVSEDSFDAWTGPKSAPDQTEWSDGDICTFGKYKGEPGRVVWAVDGKERTGNPSDYRQQDGETIAIGFLPKGVELGFPPGACDAFANISDQNTAGAVSAKSPCRDEIPTSATTAPAADSTTTTAPERASP